MVIVIDNLPVYINARIPAAIKEEGYIIYYLPPYSPDFNPIKLIWAVLKA
jgi:transposase